MQGNDIAGTFDLEAKPTLQQPQKSFDIVGSQ